MAKITLRLTIEVTYETNDTAGEVLADQLVSVARRAYDEGYLTGDTNAEVIRYNAEVI